MDHSLKYSSIASLGFSANATLKAMIATVGADAEAAGEWLMAHMNDEDFNDAPKQSVKATETIGKF